MAQDHSFDVVCKLDLQEVRNAVQQARKELATRFDFKGVKVTIEQDDEAITLTSDDDYRIKAVSDVLEAKLVKRGVPLKALDYKKIEDAGLSAVRQRIEFQQGIPIEKSREIVKFVKSTKRKVQVAIQGDQLRVSGKKLDDLQAIMGLLKEKDLGIEMQFTNYR